MIIKPSSTLLHTTIPFLDLHAQDAELHEEILSEIQAVMESSTYVLGPYVQSFEQAFATVVGVKHCVAVNSGTSALHLALIAAGVEAGDEVITVPMTFIATTWAIRYINARPVFVDIDPITYTMDPNQVESKITARTKAILPVHLYGQPADMQWLKEIADRHGIPIIEDAAQAHGATYRDQPVGSFGQSACFSFYPGKNLGAYGEAGAVVTNDDAIAERMRALRDHAQSKRYIHQETGYNYRMDAIQGAVLRVKLRLLDLWNRQRRSCALQYQSVLETLPLVLPTEAADRKHVWHQFVTLHPRRDEIRNELQEYGIQTGLHYPLPLHLQPAMADLGYRLGDFPVAERVGRECFSLPMYPKLSRLQIQQIGKALENCRALQTSPESSFI